jgi:hypothetical protein
MGLKVRVNNVDMPFEAEIPAAEVVLNSPAGSIAATTVQGALAELDSEKAPVGHNHDLAYAPIFHDHDYGDVYLAIGDAPALTDAVWDDLRFPAQGINPPGAATDPALENTTGCWLFNQTGAHTLAGIAQMPHMWKEGSTLSPHAHVTATSSGAGNTVWQLEYQIKDIGETFDFTAGWTAATPVTVATSGVDGKHAVIEFADIPMTGKHISCLIHWKLSRLGSDAADTYGDQVRLLEFDIHYQIDSMGSAQEYTK